MVNIITFFTSRTDEHEVVTKQWLEKHGYKYHNILFNKPRGGNYHWIDNHIVRATRYDGIWSELIKKEHKIENEIEMKHCPTCDSWKVLSEYNKQSSSWDKLGRMCRKCYCEYKTNKRKTDEKYKQNDIL